MTDFCLPRRPGTAPARLPVASELFVLLRLSRSLSSIFTGRRSRLRLQCLHAPVSLDESSTLSSFVLLAFLAVRRRLFWRSGGSRLTWSPWPPAGMA